MLLQIYSPNPVPLSDFVANFINNLGKISESIPLPVSFIFIIISLSSSLLFTMTSIEPCLVNLIALFNKLDITWIILFLSANNNNDDDDDLPEVEHENVF